MTTICLVCGDHFKSRLPFVEGIKSYRHLKSEHPSLWRKYDEIGSESVMATAQLDSGEIVHFIGDIVQYKGDEGNLIIEATN